MTKRRIIKWLAGLSGLCVILLFAIGFLLPRILDSPAAKEQIRSFLLKRTNGNLVIERIDLAWLPRPAVVARGASVTVGHEVSGKIQSIEVYPSIPGLFRGRLDISGMEVTSPALSVRLPEPAEEPYTIDEIEGRIRSLLASLAAEIPGMIVTVSDGSAEVRIGDRPPVLITDFDGRFTAPPGAVEVQISSRANIYDSLRVEGRIAGDTLATKGQIHIRNLRLRESMASFLPHPPEYIGDGNVNLLLGLTSVGLKKIKAEIDGGLPSLELVRATRKMVIEGTTLKATITRDEGIVHAIITSLDLMSPRLTATAELSVDPSTSSMKFKLGGTELVAEVREWALKSAGDIEVVEDVLRHVRGGKIPEIGFQASGRSFAEMWKPNNIVVTAALRDGSIFVPGPDIDLEDVSGLIVVSGEMLEVKKSSARLGKIQARDGTLRLGLGGKNPPFHLDMLVQSDAAALRSLLLRVVKDDGFHKELAQVRHVEGQLSGRLLLGESIDSLSAKVSIFETAVKGSYDPLPYPIAIKEGRFQYGDGKIALENVSGAFGLSSFSGVAGSLNFNESRQIEIDSGKLSLDVEQSKNLLNNFELLRTELKDIEFARGTLDLTSLSLKGPLDDPSRWDFTGAGTLGEIAVKHAKVSGVMQVSAGRFSATPEKLAVSNAKVNLLDASVTVDGSLESPDQAPLSLDATATGSIGAQMTAWLSRAIQLPEMLMLRSPLQVTQGRVFWRKDRDISFRGELTVADGPELAFDVVRGPQALSVKELIIADGPQRARMTLDLRREQLAFSFAGALNRNTLNRVFQTAPLEGSLIQGDIEVSAFVEEPIRFTARGRLAGRELRVPVQDESAIVEFFFLEADQDGVNVRSADLHWQKSRLSLVGKLFAEAKALRLDMNLSADRVVWAELSDLIDHGGNRGNNESTQAIVLPPLEGTVRLKADNFTFDRFKWSPFQATASISPQGIRGKIERGELCGIGTVGTVDLINEKIALDVSLSVTDGQLESTSVCLTENKQTVTGRYSLQGRIAGRETPANVFQTLTGQFEFSARDGAFLQSPTSDTPLEATFDYLNKTGDFNMAFPDLDKESFPFRLIRSRGTVEGMTLENDEAILQSSLFTIAGQGRIDLANDEIDARGLVSVRLPGDRFFSRIPIIGSILGGSILGIPVQVTGSLEQPNVTYLSPSAVGAKLLNISQTILGLPLEAIRLFTPNVRRPEER